MNKKTITKAINKLGPWYQRYNMNKCFTTDSKISDGKEWNIIRGLFNEDTLDSLRILDLGSSSGYFSTLMALEGAEVLAVDPEVLHIKQGKWTKNFFEITRNNENLLNISFKRKKASELEYSEIGYFNYILASLVLQYTDDQKKVISDLCSIADTIIIRTDNDSPENSIAFYNAEFLKHDFYMIKKILRDRPLILYKKLIKEKGEDISEEVKGSEYFEIKSIVKRYFSLSTDQIFRLTDNAYRILLTNKKSIKLEIYSINNHKAKNIIRYHKSITKDIRYPRFIGSVKTPTKIFKATRWIEGNQIDKEWVEDPIIFKEIGKNMALINLIKDPVTEQYLSFIKVNPEHMIRSIRGVLYFIGNRVKPLSNIDRYIARLLFKEIRNPDKINWFLYGYKKIRSTVGIKKLLKELEQTNETNINDGDGNELSEKSEYDSNTK